MYECIIILYSLMLSQQKQTPLQLTQSNKYQHQVLHQINHQNDKLKIFLYSFRHKMPIHSTNRHQDYHLEQNQIHDIKRQSGLAQTRKVGCIGKVAYDRLFEDQKLIKRKLISKLYSFHENIFQKDNNSKPITLSRSNFSNDNEIINPQAQSIKKHDQDNTFSFKPKKKSTNFRVRNKFSDQSSKNDYFQRSEPKRRMQIKQSQFFEVQSIESHRIIAHINTLDYLTFQSKAEEIFPFFQSIYAAMKIKQVKNPIIKRYKNCIYFGQNVVENKGVYEGMVWHFKEVFYYGEFVDGRKHGLGIEIKFQDFDVCIWKGKFSHGQKTGYFSIESKQFKYYGQLKRGQFHGEGHLINIASQYKGHFCDNLKEGIGLEKFINKSQYKGEYFNNLFDGQGQLKASSYYYKGLFKQGKPDGYGFERTTQYQYLGQFVMGKKEGKGKLKLASDGTNIECQFKNGLIVGQTIKNERQNAKSPKQLVISDYLSKDLQALNQQSQEGTLQHMLNEINKKPTNNNYFQ